MTPPRSGSTPSSPTPPTRRCRTRSSQGGGPVPRAAPGEAVLPRRRLLCDPLSLPLSDRVPGQVRPGGLPHPRGRRRTISPGSPPVFRDLTDDRETRHYRRLLHVGRVHGPEPRADPRLARPVGARRRHAGHLQLRPRLPARHHGRFEKHCCYEEAVRTVLVMRLPGVIAPGRATDALVELTDIVPTILDLCGIEIPAERSRAGPSCRCLGAGGPAPGSCHRRIRRQCGSDGPHRSVEAHLLGGESETS